MTIAEKIISDWYGDSPWSWEYWDTEDLKGLVGLIATIAEREIEEVDALLAEAFHTAFRKASEHPNAHVIWTLIRDLPKDDWTKIIDFVAECIKVQRWWEQEALDIT